MLAKEGCGPGEVVRDRTGDRLIIEWQGKDIKPVDILDGKIKEEAWLVDYGGSKFLNIFIGKIEDRYKAWVSFRDSEHKIDYVKLQQEGEEIKVVGMLYKESGYIGFRLSAVSVYSGGFLDRGKAKEWMRDNLPSW